ncbi:hypothetical protein IQ07DRAFT_123655 [Pyrenochaeta sp. DS3sAY3a]|nr:hypothetical protein IQ07DRAFT_123655 [Pyrenochaeta sp. DS3sAY3a]
MTTHVQQHGGACLWPLHSDVAPVFGGEQPTLASAMDAPMATNRGVSDQPYQALHPLADLEDRWDRSVLITCHSERLPPLWMQSTVTQILRRPNLEWCGNRKEASSSIAARHETFCAPFSSIAYPLILTTRVRTSEGCTSSPLCLECHPLISRAWLESSTTPTVDDDHVDEAACGQQPKRSSAHGRPVAQRSFVQEPLSPSDGFG